MYFDPCRKHLASLVHEGLQNIYKPSKDMLDSVGSIISAITRPPEFYMGDFALPCFRFAKSLKQKPQSIAEQLTKYLSSQKDPWLDKVETAGAFLNFFLNKKILAQNLLSPIINSEYFQALAKEQHHQNTKVMIEFSQPNTHKEFHVGHFRNVALGDTMVRLFRYLGHDVLAVNYLGDEGAHIAKCLWYLYKQKLKPPINGKGEWLGQVYVKAIKALDEADEQQAAIFQTEISDALKEIEAKKGKYFDLWQETRQWSLDDFSQIYNMLDIKFDHYFFESELSQKSQAIVDEYLKKGVFVESEGAIGADLNDYDFGFLVLRKRDGNTLYATKDLALAKSKFEEFHIDRSLYVVASEQNLHFKQVFKTLELMGFKQAEKCYHLSYGMVRLPEGKMASRSGNTVTFRDLYQQVIQQLRQIMQKYQDQWTVTELEATLHKLSVGALKYGMLNTDPVKDVVFVLDDWLSFEGNSGPYLMYSYTRTKSILNKAKEAGVDYNISKVDFALFEQSEEHELLNYLYDFNDVVRSTTEQYRPSILTHHLYDLCKCFNRFYANVSVLNAKDIKLKQARLCLISAFAEVLRVGLDLLGITPPERM